MTGVSAAVLVVPSGGQCENNYIPLEEWRGQFGHKAANLYGGTPSTIWYHARSSGGRQ